MVIHFLRPYWFIAIIPILFLLWRLGTHNLVDNWHQVCDEHLLAHLLVKPERRIKFPFLMLGLGLSISIIALAGPSWHQEIQPVYRASQGTILVLNLSPSMSESMGTTTKIDRARFKILDYLNRQKEGLTGLVVYTDEAHIISPLTEDNHTVANFVPVLDPTIMPTVNDDTEVGLREAEKLLKQTGISRGNIVLITDKVTHFSQAKQFAESLFKENYRLTILEISKQPGANTALQTLAQAGGGNVISLAPNNHDIDSLIAKTKANAWSLPTKKSNEKGLFWHDDGRWLIFLILPLVLIAFRRGYL
jgi:Ca-activated chloride channel homolog